MCRYQVSECPDGIWLVIDSETGDEVHETLDEWKARDWCDFMNDVDRIESNVDWDEYN